MTLEFPWNCFVTAGAVVNFGQICSRCVPVCLSFVSSAVRGLQRWICSFWFIEELLLCTRLQACWCFALFRYLDNNDQFPIWSSCTVGVCRSWMNVEETLQRIAGFGMIFHVCKRKPWSDCEASRKVRGSTRNIRIHPLGALSISNILL